MSDINQLVLEALVPNPTLSQSNTNNQRSLWDRVKNKVKKFYKKNEQHIDHLVDVAGENI